VFILTSVFFIITEDEKRSTHQVQVSIINIKEEKAEKHTPRPVSFFLFRRKKQRSVHQDQCFVFLFRRQKKRNTHHKNSFYFLFRKRRREAHIRTR
jgi:hypothetical protein